jgi:putative flippase GtrA
MQALCNASPEPISSRLSREAAEPGGPAASRPAVRLDEPSRTSLTPAGRAPCIHACLHGRDGNSGKKGGPAAPDMPGSLRRWIVFNVVGVLGFVVQLAVLAALMGWCRWGYIPATVLAVETAVVHNFVWHELWTWADRRQPGRFAVFWRFLRFNLTNGLVSVAGNLFFMRIFLHTLPVHYLTANTLSIAMCAIINFIASDRLVFRNHAARCIVP